MRFIVVACLLLGLTFKSFGQDLVFADGAEDPTPLDTVMGTYELETFLNLGAAYPRRASPMDDPLSGDHVDTLAGFFADPAAAMGATIASIPDIATNVTDAGTTESLMASVFTTIINDWSPDYLGVRAVVAADVRTFLEVPHLLGELTIPSEPDMSGMVTNGIHRYFAISFEWQYPCAIDPMANCDDLIFSLIQLTGDPTLDISDQIELTIPDQASMAIAAHLLRLPLQPIFTGYLENYAIPVAFQDPTVNSVDRLINKLLVSGAVDAYNATAVGMASPIVCPGACSCTEAGPALASLYEQAGGSAADGIFVGQHACPSGKPLALNLLQGALAGFAVGVDGVAWESTGSCRFTDDNDDLVADGFGGPFCDWAIQTQLANFDLLNAPGLFIGVIQAP